MIIAVFALLLAIGFAFVILGIKNHDSYFEYSGYTVIFILGFVLMAGSVEYVDGYTMRTNTTHVYGWNYSDSSEHWNDNDGPPSPPGPTGLDYMNLFHIETDEVRAATYASYSDAWTHILGVILSLVAGFAFILRLLNDRREKEAKL